MNRLQKISCFSNIANCTKSLLIFGSFFLLMSSSLMANHLQLTPIELEKTRERVLSLHGKHTIYFFTDNTIVYLRQPPHEKQTWTEWWSNIEHTQPDSKFYFHLNKWNSASSFQLYRYHWEENDSSHPLETLFNKNMKVASEYPFLIENQETGEMTLCQIWSLMDLGSFITRYGEDCYKDGYNSAIKAPR